MDTHVNFICDHSWSFNITTSQFDLDLSLDLDCCVWAVSWLTLGPFSSSINVAYEKAWIYGCIYYLYLHHTSIWPWPNSGIRLLYMGYWLTKRDRHAYFTCASKITSPQFDLEINLDLNLIQISKLYCQGCHCGNQAFIECSSMFCLYFFYKSQLLKNFQRFSLVIQ